MKKFFSCISFLLIFSSFVFSQDEAKLIRYPSINNDGTKIAFSYQGDIWTVSSNGGLATRLTIHEAYEGLPRWSCDGKYISFSGSRYGNADLYLMPSEGGVPKRLTFYSGNDLNSTWTKNGDVLFSSNREYSQLEREPEIFSISSNGGTEKRILDALGFDPAESPDGRFIAFTRHSNSIFREAYKGPANRDVWIYDTKNKSYSKLSISDANDYMPLWSDSRTIYFLSAETEKYNIYKIKIDESGKALSKPEQITNFKDYAIRHFDISSDGSTIVFEQKDNIYLLKISSGSSKKIDVIIPKDYRFDPTEFKTFNKEATEYAVSPNGKLIAFVVRGELFVKEADKEKSNSINLSEHPYRESNAVWLSDTTIIFTSDREDNNYELFFARSTDKAQPNIFKTLKHEVARLTKTDKDESSPVVSPNGKKIAYTVGNGKLIVADISADGKLSNEKILQDGWAPINGISWSPDGKWLAYSMDDLYFNEEVYIHAADNSSAPVNISMHPRNDNSPFWSVDGSKLGFLSSRSTQNAITGGLSFSRDVWFVWLKKEDWEKTKQDWDDKEPPKEEAKKDSKKESDPKPIQIDFDKIHERLVQVISLPGDESNLVISKDGETFFYTAQSSTAKGRDLYSVKWDGKDLKEMTKGGSNPSNVTIDKEGKYLYYAKQGGSLTKHDIKADKAEPLPYSAKTKIDYPNERNQIFEEAWRTIRDMFYDPQFHGKDWNALHDKYKDLCINASTETDFRDMFNYMLGELNASHMGFSTSERGETQREATGMLGVELTPTDNGMKVIHVIQNSPADKISSKLYVDDVIVAVGKDNFDEQKNFYEAITNSADEKLLLKVIGKDGKEREVVIRPTSNLRQLLYEEWVDARKNLTEKYSKGRLGYIHIQGMSLPSFEVFERELTAAGHGKEGIVIDVRYNGGGSTTDYLMTILNYKQHAYTIPRGASDNLERDKLKFRNYYPTGERLVFSALLKPSIALCNEDSYSNAEIFSHAYKTLGIGTLVGKPTNGSVISTGGRGLLDGSFVRTPFRGWFTKATDKNQELGPAIPDIIVDLSPDAKAKNVDEQLKAAVDQLLKEIDTKK